MAKTDKTKTAPNADKFDISQYLPEGFDATNVYKTGGLTPIFTPENAFQEELVAAGWIDRVMALPIQRQGKNDEYTPYMIMLRDLQVPTKGLAKNAKGEDELVTVDKGKEILIPITGSIRTNKEVASALADPSRRHFGVFRVTGTLDTDRPSPMWVWDIKLHTKTLPRDGIYSVMGVDDTKKAFLRNKEGQVYDAETGEVVDSQGQPVKKLVNASA